MSRTDTLPTTYSPFRDHDGESIVLGWQTPSDQASGMGFSQPPGDAGSPPAEPVEMGGDGHILTIAPTGSGKGVSCIIPTLLTYTGPVIVIDPKGENAAVTAERRRQMGQQVHVIDPFGISGEEPARFNPLELVNPRYADCTDDAAMIASMITPVLKNDPYWSNRAKQLITGLILHVCHDMPASDRNLLKVREILHRASLEEESVIEALRTSRHHEVRITHAGISGPAERTRQSIVSIAADALDVFRGDSMMHSLYASSFDINGVTRGDPMTIYLVLPPHMMESHGPVLRMWVGALFSLMCRRRKRPDMHTLFLIDEAAQLGTFEPLRSALTLLRGYGVRTWSFWQDLPQLKRLYPDWETLLTNCRAVQIFGRLGARSAKGAAEALGVDNPSIFRDLNRDQMVVAMNGDDPKLCHRPNYLNDRILAKLAQQNPFFSDDMPGECRRPAHMECSAFDDERQSTLFPLEVYPPWRLEQDERKKIRPRRRAS
ncbi:MULTISPECIES: type IV secretory system conjugative DNA transfer family protein [Henriciella]|jgi:type IV secretion system protein VirD4|uniref:type IV secretory system conjugative DNA transfer family protein n=1 Tax=Henriciella TaxID=453849 RepID=UPI003518BDEB